MARVFQSSFSNQHDCDAVIQIHVLVLKLLSSHTHARHHIP